MKSEEQHSDETEQTAKTDETASETPSETGVEADAGSGTSGEDTAEEAEFSKSATEEEAKDLVPAENKPPAKRQRSVMPMVFSLLALILVVAGLALGYRYWLEMQQIFDEQAYEIAQAGKQQKQLRTKLSQSQQMLEQQTQQIEVQRKSLADYQAKLEREQRDLAQRGEDIRAIYVAVEKQLGANTGVWRVSEAEHLLRTAQQSLTLTSNVDTAISALRSANQRLRETADPGWQPVRQKIASELRDLEAVPKVDVAGISATLDGLIESVDKLDLAGTDRKPYTPDAINLEHGASASIKQLLNTIWEGAKSMLVVRYNERPVEAMLPPDRRYFIIQNLRLKLESTKAALLRNEAALYRSNLNQVTTWVNSHFHKESPAVQSFLNSLTELSAVDISPALPDISGSLRTLRERRDLISQREEAS